MKYEAVRFLLIIYSISSSFATENRRKEAIPECYAVQRPDTEPSPMIEKMTNAIIRFICLISMCW